MLESLPPSSEATPYAEDLRWLLGRLSRGEPIRINSGGLDHSPAAGGPTWSRDRFFVSGSLANTNSGVYRPGRTLFAEEIDGTDDDPLYQTERWFPGHPTLPDGYRIPLPPGRYQVALHFAEVNPRNQGIPGARVFDVLLEGETVLVR